MDYWDRITKERIGRRRLLKTGAALSLGAGALVAVGCSSSDNNSSATNTPGSSGNTPTSGTPSTTATPGAAGKPVSGGTYGNYFATVGSYNIAVYYHDGYNNSGITAYDRMMTSTLTGQGYVLEAAEKMELPEPTKVVLTLKPGQVYQDLEPANGRPVKASDIVAYQEYVRDLPNAENSGFQRIYMDKVEAPDDTTVIFTLKQPYAYLTSFSMLSSATEQVIVPEEMLDVLESHPAVGSGPWQLTDHTFGAEYNYKKFANWRDADSRAWFDGMHIVSLTDAVAQETAFRGGEISEWQPAGSQVSRLLSELDKTKYANVNFLNPGILGFNAMMNKELGGPRPWNDVRFREAVYRLTNRQQWIDLVYDGKAQLSTGPVQVALEPYQLTTDETDKYFMQDEAAAKQLLSAMNYDTSQDWEIVCSNTSGTNAQMGEIWQQQLDKAGIKVHINPMPLAEMNPNHIRPAKFDLFIGGQPGGDTPFRAIRNQHSDTTDQFTNVGLYDPDIDALIEKSEQTLDRDQNIQLVKEIQRKVLDLYTMSYNAFADQRYKFYDANVEDFDPDPLNGQIYYVDQWFKEGKA
jgi:peptide/nickel transport system substrate-binding protein